MAAGVLRLGGVKGADSDLDRSDPRELKNYWSAARPAVV